MKREKITSLLLLASIAIVCVFNVQNITNMSKDIGYKSLGDMVRFNSAYANEKDEENHNLCVGSICDKVNGLEYTRFGLGAIPFCCGIASATSGAKVA